MLWQPCRLNPTCNVSTFPTESSSTGLICTICALDTVSGVCPGVGAELTCEDELICNCLAPSLGACVCNDGADTCCGCDCGTCDQRCRDVGLLPSWTEGIPTRTDLSLANQNLQGTLSRDIGDLVQLTALRLNNNNIRGTIPEFLGQLTKLRHLDLSNNDFIGTLPISLDQLQQLTYL